MRHIKHYEFICIAVAIAVAAVCNTNARLALAATASPPHVSRKTASSTNVKHGSRAFTRTQSSPNPGHKYRKRELILATALVAGDPNPNTSAVTTLSRLRSRTAFTTQSIAARVNVASSTSPIARVTLRTTSRTRSAMTSGASDSSSARTSALRFVSAACAASAALFALPRTA
eukprot:CAMPEP_0179626840 /NCGR_PEP_ID=MMETSP0932-20121108/4028_1 /TAXON_ID=548131 ORGANISM="Ostreococcus mediterraneus, Strain clade-D-RCC2596" /NCGR_SAMPLE_ID=MMETSP0932 /ASSEMBLY_ACC=CAM_ASM_000582 /LENGTH=172 /DNA_ID=CAMNT_0021496159 /DNA_START=237 /DNA_END=754 /DNA_ORIENTATION=+